MFITEPPTENHAFAPAFANTLFKDWSEKGIRTFLDLFIDHVFPSFEHVQNKYDIPKSQFYKYLQIQIFVMQNNPSYPNSPDPSSMEVLLQHDPSKRGGITKLCGLLSNLSENTTTDHLRLAWQDDLGREITEDHWQTGLLQFKITHRLWCIHTARFISVMQSSQSI